MKVTCFDLECSNLNADYGIVLCGCMTDWQPKKARRVDVRTYRIDETPGYLKERWNDHALVCQIRGDLEQSDIIVSWNGKRFDVPYLNGRLMYWGERQIGRASCRERV